MEINYIKLGMTIFIALTLSELTVNGIQTYIATSALIEINNKIKIKEENNKIEFIKKQKEREIKKQRIEYRNEQKAIKDKKAKVRRKNIRKQNNETCKFWIEKYKNIKSEYNEVMKKSACERARKD